MRRRKQTILAVLALVALWSHAPLPAEAQKRGGTLTFGVAAEPPTYDCHAGNTFAVTHTVAPHYSTLLKFDVANYPRIVGDLAESWSVSADQLTFTFKLHQGVTFHDGGRLTSADVKASWERLRDPPQGVLSIRRAHFADIARIDTPDPATVVFTLSKVNAAMLTTFASPWNCIYSAARLAQEPNYPARSPMGSGPFRFVEHVKGSHYVGARFDGYFRGGRPFLDGYRAVFVPDPSALATALQGGTLQAEFRGLTPAQRDTVKGALGDQIRIEESPEIVHLVLAFDTRKAPFDDVRVRRALNLAIDRWTASDGLARTSRLKAVGGIMRPGSPWAPSEAELTALPGFGRDAEAARAEARRLLREAGHERLAFTLSNRNFSPYTVAGVYLVDQWRRIGVTVEHKPLETAAWTQLLTQGGFDAIVDFGAEFVDEPTFGLTKYLSHDRSPINPSRAIDRVLDDLHERQSRLTDIDERRRLVRQFERHLFDQAYAVPILWTQRIIATRQQVRGWAMSASNALGQDLADVHLD
jgi:peptide/nickel transport system substrate-binding protein